MGFWLPVLDGGGAATTAVQFTADAIIKGTSTTTFTADAVVSSPVSAWPHSPTETLTHAVSGWDDGSHFSPRFVRNLDGTLHRDGSGFAYVCYIASDRELQYTGATYIGDTDVPGAYKTLDFTTYTKITPSAPLVYWNSGTHSNAGGEWDCRVVQPFAYFWTGTEYLMFYSGDRGPRSVVEDYGFGVATAPTMDGTWTKDAGNPQISHGAPGTMDFIMYGGDAVYDDDPDSESERWRIYYTAIDVSYNWKVGLMFADTPDGTYTRYGGGTGTAIFDWTSATYPGVSWAAKLEDGWYVAVEEWDHDVAGRQHVRLFRSTDGKTSWTDLGEVFTGGATGRWDDNMVFNIDVVEDTVLGVNWIVYTGQEAMNLTDEQDLAIGIQSWQGDLLPGITRTRTKTFTADAVVSASGSTKTFTADAIIYAPPYSVTYTADAVVFGTNTKTYTADAVLVDTASQNTALSWFFRRRRSDMPATKTYTQVQAKGTTRTATWTSPTYKSETEAGILVVLDVTAASGTGGLTLRVNAQDSAGGVSVPLNSAPTAVTAVGTTSYAVYPFGAISGALTQSTSGYLPRQFSITVTHGDSSSYTYSVGFTLLP